MVTISWRQMSELEHFVQFYESDAFLAKSLSEFVGAGLMMGEAVIVLATSQHRESLEAHLRRDGLQVAVARERGQYIAMDAANILPRLIVDGQPDPLRFSTLIGDIIARAAEEWGRVRIFGELVALLWAAGNRAAAIHLEDLWNELAHIYSFSLFCAYPMRDFGDEDEGMEFVQICERHSQVIPAESYSTLKNTNERLRAIVLLQLKSTSLEAEIEKRKATEKRLYECETCLRLLREAFDRRS